MRIERAKVSTDKGWLLLGLWKSSSELAIGYANKGIDEPHVHRMVTEI